VPWGRLRL